MGWLRSLDSGLFAVDMALRALVERVETGISFNPATPNMHSDPHPFYKRLREFDPIHRSRPADGWILARHADILEVLGDRSFSSDERNLRRWKRNARRDRLAGIPDPYETDRVTMLRSDAPDHTRTRDLVNKAFTPRAVERMRARIEEVVDELIVPMQNAQHVELVSDFAAPLPVVVIAEMLGVPTKDRDRFQYWSDQIVRTLGDSTPEDQQAAEIGFQRLRDYFEQITNLRRAEPRDDLLSALVAVEEQGERLSMGELLGTLVLLLVAGNETTAKLISNAVVALLRNPDQLELLQNEPKRIAGAVDELLRFDGPVQLTSRMVLEDRDFHGRRFQRGQQIVLLLAAGNRDPEQYDNPDTLDVTRENVRHLALGHGSHFCLGAQLARLEASLALEALLTRLPTLRFGDEPVAWGNNTVLRGPRKLPLRV